MTNQDDELEDREEAQIIAINQSGKVYFGVLLYICANVAFWGFFVLCVVVSLQTYNCEYKYHKICNVTYLSDTNNYKISYYNISKIMTDFFAGDKYLLKPYLAGKDHIDCFVKNGHVEIDKFDSCDLWWRAFIVLALLIAVSLLLFLILIGIRIVNSLKNAEIHRSPFWRQMCCFRNYETMV